MNFDAIRIRPASPEDGTVVRTLLDGADLPSSDIGSLSEGWVVAQAGDVVVGAAAIEVHPPFGLLRSAVVEPSWRGHGVGIALTRDRLAWARMRGLVALYLLTTTAPDFFARFGFQAVPRVSAPPEIRASREFAELCPDTAVLMAIELNA